VKASLNPLVLAGRFLALGLLLVTASVAQAADSRALNALFDGVVSEHVKDGYVDYPAIARNVRFTKYLESLAEFNLDSLTDDKEKLAFWLNVYNALVIKNIIDGKSPNGMMDHMTFFGSNIKIGGRGFDLNAIEGDILRKFKDPRVYFGIVPATSSAPKLRSQAFTGEQVDQQLEAAARDFINDKRRNRFSAALQAAKLSKVFEEHRAEFGKSDKELLTYVAGYVNDEEVAKILKRGTYDVKFMDYDATINGNSIQSH
jgi:hypothetical protein